MRIRLLLAVVTATGCTVEVGAGTIAPVAVDEPVDATDESPPLSLPMEIEFLSADQSAAIADQYGSELGNVTAIDLDVQELGVTDGDGAPVPGGALVVTFDGVTIAHAGDRVTLPDDVKKSVLAAIAQRAALDVSLRATVDWAPPPPPSMDAHALLQPIVIVNPL